MKKLLLTSLLIIGLITMTGCTPNIYKESQNSIDGYLNIINNEVEKQYSRLQNGKIKKDNEGYYKLNENEQKDRFYLQKAIKSHPFNLFTFMDFEYEDERVLTNSQIYPLSYEGELEFYSTDMRYPFIMNVAYFKNFKITGKVKQGQIDIEIKLPSIQKDKDGINYIENYTYQTKNYQFSSGEEININPRNDFNIVEPNTQRLEIYITSMQENSIGNYSFEFQNNSK